jgi:delta(3,5)-delta(2,4)-dienoyl-CoA isomerase
MTSLTNYKYAHFIVTSPAPYVAHVEINRASKLNAFHRNMWLEFGDIFDKLSHDPEVRAVVLSGAGDKAFTAGLDVKAAAEEGVIAGGGASEDVARKATALRRYIFEFQECITRMEKCEKRECFLWSFFPLRRTRLICRFYGV